MLFAELGDLICFFVPMVSNRLDRGSSMEKRWQDIELTDAEVTLTALDDIELPRFQENAIRVALGKSFRRTVCINPAVTDCTGCSLETLCVYNKIFFNSANSLVRGSPYSFISFFAPNTPKFLNAGSDFRLCLRLFGKTTSYFPYYYFCLENLGSRGIGLRSSDGRRGRFTISQIHVTAPDGQKTLIFTRDNSDKTLKADSFPLARYIDFHDHVQSLKIHILSPLRIKYQSHLNDSLEFHILLRAALRRISGIYALTNGKQLDLEYHDLINRAKAIKQVENNLRWFDYYRYSTTQSQGMKLGGVLGEVTYKGDLTEFYPFIKAAGILAVGKSTSFGFGRFRVSIEGR